MSRKNKKTSVPVVPEAQQNQFFDFDLSKDDSQTWFEMKAAAGKMLRFSPDIVELEQYDKHFIFLYDGMQTGLTFHKELNLEPVYKASTKDGSLTLYKHKLGKRSVAFAMKAPCLKHKGASIRGELYLAPTDKVLELDERYDNTRKFIRTKVIVKVPYSRVVWVKDRADAELYAGKPLQKSVITITNLYEECEAYMYLANPDYYLKLLDKSSVCKRVKKNNKGLFEFTDWEYQFDWREAS